LTDRSVSDEIAGLFTSGTRLAMTPAHATRQPAGDAVDRILAAAARLFAEHGFEAASMNTIADAAGVSKANVFHHFNTKNDLYVAVLQHACRDASEHLNDLDREGQPLGERLTRFAGAHLQSLLANDQVTRLSLRELLRDSSRHGQELAEKVYGEKFSRFVAVLRAGQQAGELRADIDPAVVATVLLGANVFFFEAREVLQHFPDVKFGNDPERYSRMLADVVLRGIRPTTRE
jgi:TetR/AcrR family transcriptional regulator